MTPKVSIIVPCYGVEKYLNRCMRTIVNQTLTEIEIILVDDKSPDCVPEMCEEWAKKDSRIKVIHKHINEGLGLARNTGLEIATGEYIAFVDSDDFLNTDMYRILYTKAVEKKLDAVYCNCIEYIDNEHQHKDIDVDKETDFIGKDSVDLFLLDMIGPTPEYPNSVKYRGSVWHAIYKHSIIKDNNVQFVSEREFVSEDLVYDIDYLPHSEHICWIPDSLYYHCYNGESLSHTINDNKYNRIKRFIQQIDNRLSKIYPQEKYFIHLQRYCIFLYLTVLRWSAKNKFETLTFYQILNDSFWSIFLNKYPIGKMPAKYYITLSLCKYRRLSQIAKFILSKK